MKKQFVYVLLLFACLFSACGDDEDYEYPSVKLEFLTVESGNDGTIVAVTPDKGSRMFVAEDLSNTKIEANGTRRVISNYEEVAGESGIKEAKIYAVGYVVSAQPLPPAAFKDGVVTDPANVLSIWMGKDYLNIILNIKAQSTSHTFHFVETETGIDAETGHKYAKIMLYHDNGGDVPAYTKRAYVSMPLSKYKVTGETVDIYFSLNTEDEGVKTYSFEYIN